MIDHYKRMGIGRDASKRKIREAFMFLAGFLNPDSTDTGFSLAERKEMYRELVRSFLTLIRDKEEYDKALKRGQAEDTSYILGNTMIITDTLELKRWLGRLGREGTIEEKVNPYNQKKDERGTLINVYA